MIYLVIYLWVIGGYATHKGAYEFAQENEPDIATLTIIIWPFVFAVAFIWHFGEWLLKKIKRGN